MLCPADILNPSTLRRVIVPKAFSLMELIITIAVIGVLASVVVNLSGGAPSTIQNTKLQSDVNLLNQMVGLYLSDGGSLTGATTPQAVLDKMKKTRTATDAKQHAGPATGRLVDIRLRARMGSGPLPGGRSARAVWSSSKKRFELSSGSASGVEEFYLDEALASTDYGTETRNSSVVKFNSSATATNGWVWGNTTNVPITTKSPIYIDPTGTETYFNPSESASASASGSGSGSGSASGSGSGSASGSGSGGSPVVLPTPILSPAGGTFGNASFPSSVSINSNGAPPAQSSLEYQLNGGAWQSYSSVIAISSSDSINARNTTLVPASFSDSAQAAETYYQLVSDFNGGGVGSWGNVQGGSNLVQTTANGDPTSTLTHGNTKLDLGGGNFLDAGVANELSFTKTDFTGATPNTWFTLGSVSMLNGTTFYDSESSGATLTVNLNLTQPVSTGVVHVDLGFISTENNGNSQENADIVELKNPSTDFTTMIGGVTYRLELSWVSLNPGTGTVQGNQFLIYEGATAQAQLQARFVPDH